MQPWFGYGHMSSAKIDDSFLEESVGNVEFTVKSIGYIIIIHKLCIHYISKINKIGNELMHILIYIVVCTQFILKGEECVHRSK